MKRSELAKMFDDSEFKGREWHVAHNFKTLALDISFRLGEKETSSEAWERIFENLLGVRRVTLHWFKEDMNGKPG